MGCGVYMEVLWGVGCTCRYRVFATLKRERGCLPSALFHGVKGEKQRVTVWCSNDYLGMSQHPVVLEVALNPKP